MRGKSKTAEISYQGYLNPGIQHLAYLQSLSGSLTWNSHNPSSGYPISPVAVPSQQDAAAKRHRPGKNVVLSMP